MRWGAMQAMGTMQLMMQAMETMQAMMPPCEKDACDGEEEGGADSPTREDDDAAVFDELEVTMDEWRFFKEYGVQDFFVQDA